MLGRRHHGVERDLFDRRCGGRGCCGGWGACRRGRRRRGACRRGNRRRRGSNPRNDRRLDSGRGHCIPLHAPDHQQPGQRQPDCAPKVLFRLLVNEVQKALFFDFANAGSVVPDTPVGAILVPVIAVRAQSDCRVFRRHQQLQGSRTAGASGATSALDAPRHGATLIRTQCSGLDGGSELWRSVTGCSSPSPRPTRSRI